MKKIVYLIVITFFSATYGIAQFKEYPKLTNFFTEKKYEECIKLALKLNSKESKELNPILYCAKSYFELYKNSDEKAKLSKLKNSLKYASKIEKTDKESEYITDYEVFLEELHNAALKYAGIIFDGPDKDKSKAIFDYLAKMYKDTTAQYYTFYPDQLKKPLAETGLNTINQAANLIDSKGLKQGFWSKVYPNGNKAYEVNFKDDIPIGEYKRYHENGKLMIFIAYDEKGEWGDAKIYNDKSELIAEGKYHKRLKSGHWTYYKDSIKAAEDNYKEDKRDGPSKTFYKNGVVSDERNYTEDIENGVWRQYFPSGKLKLETRIDNGIRNSVYYVYHDNGQFETKGHYKNDKMDGEWIYYDNKGKEIQRLTYVMGKTDKQDELDLQENKIFLEMDKNKNRLADPANFINNPDEYLRQNGLK